ncbi:DUF3955 domain-containing protein [uncultured Nitratireductor sp.]|uniref:DUF3955 domain-containing protein n=1 Tax=uncultured Nitratireductor sp. TaxID=520953 RepID=UPI0025E0B891|nr:DUF3955 domain-containing protein [uncultured Nitratireductor sp.]
MKFLFFCALFLVMAGGACLAAAGWIGSSVDANGFLHEPFALIALGSISIALGAASGTFGIGIAAWRRVSAS